MADPVVPGKKPLFTIKPVYWNAAKPSLREIRNSVFVEEQGVPTDMEWDGLDEHAFHVAAYAADGTVIGTGRLLQDAHIGRMSVVKEWRCQGVGTALLDMLLVLANKMGYEEVRLHAQVRVLDFYLRKGFQVEGQEFMEAGIPHLAMFRTTADQTSWPAAFVTRAPQPGARSEARNASQSLPTIRPGARTGAR